jgi:hypothetical protein
MLHTNHQAVLDAAGSREFESCPRVASRYDDVGTDDRSIFETHAARLAVLDEDLRDRG